VSFVDRPSLSIIVFAFDEEENVAAVLGELRAWLTAHEPRSEIVLVDDGSRDRTLEVATAALEGFPHRTARHSTNRGIGAALKTGVALARGEWVTFLPADGQIEPAAVATLRAAASDDEVDLVLSVYDHRDDGLHRTLLSAGVRALITMVHGVRLQSDGPYLFRRTIFVPDELPPDTFFLNFELPIRALAAGLRVRTVQIACRPRRAGTSKSTGLRRIVGVARDLVDLRRRRTERAFRLWTGRPG
jgi:glycosyltransferase involved in cell wall biosynthesis